MRHPLCSLDPECCARGGAVGSSYSAFATGNDAAPAPQADPAPCNAAVAASDDDKIIAACGVLIDSDKTVKADRIKALLARAAANDRKGMIDRTIEDYSTVLRH